MNKSNRALFDELEVWSRMKNSFSVSDFLKEKEISLDEFEQIANSNKKFMKIWSIAESKAWDNVKNSIFSKSLPRSKIVDYIKELDIFQGREAEEVMRGLKEGQEKLEMYLMALMILILSKNMVPA